MIKSLKCMKRNFFLATVLLPSAFFWSGEGLDAQDNSQIERNSKGVTSEAEPYALIMNTQARDGYSLDGVWNCLVDPYETGYYSYRMTPNNDAATFFADKSFHADRTDLVEYDFDTAPTLRVPGDWNTQNDKLYYYEGTIWYRRKFNHRRIPGQRVFLYFEGANYETIVGLNGRKAGRHVGGFTPFDFEVTDRIADGENSVVVKVDNRRKPEGVPTINADWWNYGGLTRSVKVLCVPETFIRDYELQLTKEQERDTRAYRRGLRRARFSVRLDGSHPEQSVTLAIAELNFRQTVRTGPDGTACAEFSISPELWSPESPKLYDVEISSETDTVRDRIGFRTVRTEGTKLLLNDRPIFCKGISIHEEAAYGLGGRAWCREQDCVLLDWAKELGCNFVRLAHYPHNEAMIRLAEEMGLLVWSEIPVYWTINWDNAETYANAENQLEEMIARDRNRANIIIWSVANETPRSPERLSFLRRLIDRTRELDDTRLISSAMEKADIGGGMMTLNDELAEYTDLLSFNEYVGWYDGDSKKCDRVNWTFSYDKPVFISEFGAGALYNRHGRPDERFTEEYMTDFYERSLRMLDRIPGLCGCTPWVLKDFRSPKRMLTGIQDDYNRKGLVSDRGQKKNAFEVVQKWYSEK